MVLNSMRSPSPGPGLAESQILHTSVEEFPHREAADQDSTRQEGELAFRVSDVFLASSSRAQVYDVDVESAQAQEQAAAGSKKEGSAPQSSSQDKHLFKALQNLFFQYFCLFLLVKGRNLPVVHEH